MISLYTGCEDYHSSFSHCTYYFCHCTFCCCHCTIRVSLLKDTLLAYIVSSPVNRIAETITLQRTRGPMNFFVFQLRKASVILLDLNINEEVLQPDHYRTRLYYLLTSVHVADTFSTIMWIRV
jgi:hypothetical protein